MYQWPCLQCARGPTVYVAVCVKGSVVMRTVPEVQAVSSGDSFWCLGQYLSISLHCCKFWAILFLPMCPAVGRHDPSWTLPACTRGRTNCSTISSLANSGKLHNQLDSGILHKLRITILACITSCCIPVWLCPIPGVDRTLPSILKFLAFASILYFHLPFGIR